MALISKEGWVKARMARRIMAIPCTKKTHHFLVSVAIMPPNGLRDAAFIS
jgi:hypothetical protein